MMTQFFVTMIFIVVSACTTLRPPPEDVGGGLPGSTSTSRREAPPKPGSTDQRESPPDGEAATPHESAQEPASKAPLEPTRARPEAAPLKRLDHRFFVIHYDERFRLPQFVVYQLTREQLLHHHARRANRFFADPLLTGPVRNEDYARTGYDRGHMAPAGDFSFDQRANNETFVLSNMAPQRAGLNRIAWKALEEQVRRWACGEEKVTVITGPVLKPGLPRLKSGLPVPEKFFKVVIDETPPRKVIAFLYSQLDDHDVRDEREVSVARLVEELRRPLPVEVLEAERGPAGVGAGVGASADSGVRGGVDASGGGEGAVGVGGVAGDDGGSENARGGSGPGAAKNAGRNRKRATERPSNNGVLDLESRRRLRATEKNANPWREADCG